MSRFREMPDNSAMDYDPSDWEDEDRRSGTKKKNKKQRGGKKGYFDDEGNED